MRQQTNTFQKKEWDKTPEKQLRGDRKRIHRNDSKDDPRSKKRMEAQSKKIQEMFNKYLEI